MCVYVYFISMKCIYLPLQFYLYVIMRISLSFQLYYERVQSRTSNTISFLSLFSIFSTSFYIYIFIYMYIYIYISFYLSIFLYLVFPPFVTQSSRNLVKSEYCLLKGCTVLATWFGTFQLSMDASLSLYTWNKCEILPS